MRSNVAHYDLIAPGSLAAVLNTLADSPGEFTPIAGGTELMVALGAGRLGSEEAGLAERPAGASVHRRDR